MPRPKKTAKDDAPKEQVRVAFSGQIKTFKSDIDAVGDKVGTLTIKFNPGESIIPDLDVLQKPNKSVFVVIMENPK